MTKTKQAIGDLLMYRDLRDFSSRSRLVQLEIYSCTPSYSNLTVPPGQSFGKRKKLTFFLFPKTRPVETKITRLYGEFKSREPTPRCHNKAIAKRQKHLNFIIFTGNEGPKAVGF